MFHDMPEMTPGVQITKKPHIKIFHSFGYQVTVKVEHWVLWHLVAKLWKSTNIGS